MEEYVNEKTVIKDNTYNILKDSILCKSCGCIMIEPVMCFECQDNFCKKCVEKWKNEKTCPKKCKNPTIKDVIQEKNKINRLKFKCVKGCGEEIPFDDLKAHYSSNCLKNKKKKKIRSLNKDEVGKYVKQNGAQIERITSK